MINFKLSALALAMAVAGATTSAQAAPVTYNFTANISSLSELQSTGSFADVASASLGGSHIALGEKVSGSITYDAATAQFAFDNLPDEPNTSYSYALPTFNLQYKTESGGYSFSSVPGNPDSATTFNDPTGDSLTFDSVSTEQRLGLDLLNYIRFGFFDQSSQLLNSAAMPASLGAAGQVVGSFAGIFRTTDFTSNINYSATLTSFAPAVTAVPEPETYAMMLAGLGMLGMAARRKRGGDKV